MIVSIVRPLNVDIEKFLGDDPKDEIALITQESVEGLDEGEKVASRR